MIDPQVDRNLAIAARGTEQPADTGAVIGFPAQGQAGHQPAVKGIKPAYAQPAPQAVGGQLVGIVVFDKAGEGQLRVAPDGMGISD